MHLLIIRNLLAICIFVLFSFDGACSRRLTRSSFSSCGKEIKGFSFDSSNPDLNSEILSMKVVRKKLLEGVTQKILNYIISLGSYRGSYHLGILATLKNNRKILIHKVFVKLFLLIF